jgi:hypothetical protein
MLPVWLLGPLDEGFNLDMLYIFSRYGDIYPPYKKIKTGNKMVFSFDY